MSTLRIHALCSLPRMAGIPMFRTLQLYPFIPILPNQEITHNHLDSSTKSPCIIKLNLSPLLLIRSRTILFLIYWPPHPGNLPVLVYSPFSFHIFHISSRLLFASNPISCSHQNHDSRNSVCVFQSLSLLNMAVANGIQPRGNIVNSSFLQANKSNQIYSSNPCLSTFNQTQKTAKKSLSVSFDLSNNSAIVSSPKNDVLKGDDDSQSKDSVSSEKIETWIQESVADIVKNLKKAPLLVQIHAENNGFGEKRGPKFNIERASFENWDFLKSEWENEGSEIPDAVVFVEELEHDQENSNQESGEGGVNRVWGMVVQGKGVDCVPRCYLLKTNRICGGLGLGFCTHFCLMRVMDFRESALGQLKDCWLLQ